MIMKRWGQHIWILVCLVPLFFFLFICLLMQRRIIIIDLFPPTPDYDPSHRQFYHEQNAFITFNVCLCIGFYIVCEEEIFSLFQSTLRPEQWHSHSHQIKIFPTSLPGIQIYALTRMGTETWDALTLDTNFKGNKRAQRQIYCLYFHFTFRLHRFFFGVVN